MLKILKRQNAAAFTLVEMIIYVGIFAIVSGLMITILIIVTQVREREVASAEVTNQINFVIQTIQRLTRDSSNIDISANIPTSTLKFIMRDQTKNPTVLKFQNGVITIKEGSGVETNLTNDRVAVNSLSFTKTNLDYARDTVSIDITMTYRSQNSYSQIARTLRSAIGRASAAVVFDADIIPSNNSYTVGQDSSSWGKIIVGPGSASNPSYGFDNALGVGIFKDSSGALGFATNQVQRMTIDTGGNVGIGSNASAGAKFLVAEGDLGVSNQGSGLILRATDGSNCFRLTVNNVGEISTLTVMCP